MEFHLPIQRTLSRKKKSKSDASSSPPREIDMRSFLFERDLIVEIGGKRLIGRAEDIYDRLHPGVR